MSQLFSQGGATQQGAVPVAGAGNDSRSIIIRVAQELGVDPNLALAIAQQESGLNPNAVGDGGHSVGLFQLNDQGEGAGMSVAQRQNAETNARIALAQVAAVARQHPGWSGGQIAAAAQRPADQAGYAQSVNAIMGGGTSSIGAGGGGGGSGGTQAGGPAQPAKPSVPFSLTGTYPITPQVQQWIQQNAGQDAWMLSNPELSKIIGYAAQNQITDQNEIQSLVAQTNWYKTHATAQRAWTQLYASDPQEAAREIQQSQQSVKDLAGKLGVTLTPDQVNTLSINSNYYGWSNQELQQAVAQYLGPKPAVGDAGNLFQQLRETANSYLVPISDATIGDWTRQIVSGQAQPDKFDGYIKEQAKTLFANNPKLVEGIDQGMTMQQLVDPYRQLAAQTLEIDPGTINFMDPKWMSLINTVDPKSGQSGPMGLGAAATFLRSNAQYGYQNTNGARDQAYGTVQNLVQSLGMIK